MHKGTVVLVLCLGSVTAAQAQNQPPNAVIRTNPAASAGNVIMGYSPLTVTFNACKSTDPDNDPLKYAFDLDGDGTLETIGTCRFTVVYHAAVIAGRQVTVCVSDRTNFEDHKICKSFYLFNGPEPERETTSTPRTLYAVTAEEVGAGSAEVVAAVADGGDTLVKIDPASGALTVVGPIGFSKTSALEAAGSGRLYATAQAELDSDSSEVSGLRCASPVLIEIDPATGAGSEVGPLDLGLCSGFDDLAFAGSTLIGLHDGSVYTINTATGQATLAVDEIDEGFSGGLADRSGTVYYGSSENPIYTVDVGGGTATATGAVLDYSALTGEGATLRAMTANGVTMHGLVETRDGDTFRANVEAPAGGENSLLVEINLGDGRVTRVTDISTTTRVLGLAWSR